MRSVVVTVIGLIAFLLTVATVFIYAADVDHFCVSMISMCALVGMMFLWDANKAMSDIYKKLEKVESVVKDGSRTTEK